MPKMSNKIFIYLFVIHLMILSLEAKVLYSFINNSVNHLNWSAKTEEKAQKKDFTYLELEAGVAWDWGEFYTFVDYENPFSPWDAPGFEGMRLSLQPTLDIKLKNNWSIRLQEFAFLSKNYYISNFIFGLSYKFTLGRTFWIKPYIGNNYQNSTYYTGQNGYGLGWVFNYNFRIHKQRFSLTQWHQQEHKRNNKDYALSDGTLVGDGRAFGLNGAFILSMHFDSQISLALQYRYADFELGYAGFQSAIISTVKYNY